MSPSPSAAAVASGHPEVCAAAADLLDAGGNAFDAAVGAGLASTLVEPALTSLGGGGFLLARSAEGRARVFDFFVDTPGRGLLADVHEPHFLPVTVVFPGSQQVFNVGRGAVAVPGTLLGLLHVHERLGRLPLEEVVAPAARLAREGVPLNTQQAYFLGLLEPIMTLTEGARAIYAPQGRLLRAGETLRNPDLAAFLEALPREGARAFYAGEVAARIHQDMQAGDGLLTREDLARYRVAERDPLAAGFRGRTLLTNPAPSFGGPLLAASLERLEQHRCGDDPRGGRRLRALVSVMREVDRLRANGDAPLARFSRGTTHVSVCDADGNAASMTCSNGEGSGYVAPGTGIMLNNMMGEDDLHPDGFFGVPPGRRVASGMSPSLLLRDGEPALVLGSGGSKRIRTALLQVLELAVDFGLSAREAVEHPRVHWDGEQAQLEPGFPAQAVAALREDVPVNEWSTTDLYFGGVHAVGPRGEAGGDPRRGGSTRVRPGATPP